MILMQYILSPYVAFNKFTVRFKAVKDLTLKEHMCILRNRLHFDVMDAPMLDLKGRYLNC